MKKMNLMALLSKGVVGCSSIFLFFAFMLSSNTATAQSYVSKNTAIELVKMDLVTPPIPTKDGKKVLRVTATEINPEIAASISLDTYEEGLLNALISSNTVSQAIETNHANFIQLADNVSISLDAYGINKQYVIKLLKR